MFSVIRDMTSRRICGRCHHVWPCPPKADDKTELPGQLAEVGEKSLRDVLVEMAIAAPANIKNPLEDRTKLIVALGLATDYHAHLIMSLNKGNAIERKTADRILEIWDRDMIRVLQG